MRTASWRALLIASSFAALLATTPAGAQDDDRARARALFTQGVGEVGEQRWAEAEALFREALTLYDAPSIRYNLASVLFEQGEYPEASELVDAVLANDETPADIRAHATELRAHVDQRAGYARIHLDGAEGDRVDLDGREVPDLSREIPLAPGEHRARASREDRELATAVFSIATGEHRTVELDASEAELESAERPIATEPAPGGEPPLVEQWWLWAAVGGGVVVIGVVIGAVAASSSGVEAPIVGNYEPGVLTW